jgi:hypothetical protein
MKLLKITFLFCAVFIGTLSNGIANQYIISNANTLMKKAVMAENKDELNFYLHEFKELTIRNKDNDTLKKMYANTLTSTKKYKEAYVEYKQINDKNLEPNVKVLECMLLKKTDKKDLSCYQNAITMYERNHINDINYVIALILGEDQRAEDKKASYLKNNKVDEFEKHILSISRDEYINLILP